MRDQRLRMLVPGSARPARGGSDRLGTVHQRPKRAAMSPPSPKAPAPWGGGSGAARDKPGRDVWYMLLLPKQRLLQLGRVEPSAGNQLNPLLAHPYLDPGL